eukprot:1971464-Lingulodinium_polyedra.AAC.1
MPCEGKEREGAVNARILERLDQTLGCLPAHVDRHDGGGSVPLLPRRELLAYQMYAVAAVGDAFSPG